MYPIVSVETKDSLKMHGMLFEAEEKEKILIHVHGTGGNFYENPFVSYYADLFPKTGVSFLSGNNRGTAELFNSESNTGASAELFEDSVHDIDAWIKFALDLGYKEIILHGHSFGTEKAIYYMQHGTYVDKISHVILIGFADSYGHHMQFLESSDSALGSELMEDAKQLVDEGRGNEFVRRTWLADAGILPLSANTYVNFFSDNSELSKTLPFHDLSKFNYYSDIDVPILCVIGDQEEYTYLPIKNAMQVLESKNKKAEVLQFENCPHHFLGSEEKLVKKIVSFLEEN